MAMNISPFSVCSKRLLRSLYYCYQQTIYKSTLPAVQKKENKNKSKLYENVKKKLIKFNIDPSAVTQIPMNYNDIKHGNYETFYRFDEPSSLDGWVITTDSLLDGKSTAKVTFSQNRTLIFHGNICTDVPKDGKTQNCGMANLGAPRRYSNWIAPTAAYDDWSDFNCLVLKFRGDGRTYNLLLGCDYVDLDLKKRRFIFPLFTRGGPYWQTAKIPFNRFYITEGGQHLDKFMDIPAQLISHFSITLADRIDGPFRLEIESIAIYKDVNITGKTVYEQRVLRISE